MHNPRTGLYSALTVCSLMIMESYLRSPYIDFSLAAVVTWSYWAYLKSDHFTKTRFNLLFACLTLVGMLCKWSYLPLFLGVFLIGIFLRSLIRRTFTKRDLLNLVIYSVGVALAAYFLYYRIAMSAVIGNCRSCTARPDDYSYLLDLHFYWHCFGKYLILLIRGDYLTIAGPLSLIAFAFTLAQPRRFRANLEPLLLFILPNIILVLGNFEFAVPRYLVGCLGLQCVLIGSILDRARYNLGIFFLTLMIVAKTVFLGAWMVPELGIPHCSYDYLDGDAFHVLHSRNVFSMVGGEEEELTPGIIVNTLFGGRQNWCVDLNRNWFADLKHHGLLAGTFTSPPYNLPWLTNLDNTITAIFQAPESTPYASPGMMSVATFSNEMRSGMCLCYAVNHALAMNKVWKYDLSMCLDFCQVKDALFGAQRAGKTSLLVMALMLEQRPHQGFPWPSRPIMERRRAVRERIRAELGPNWQVCAFFPNQRQRVVTRATMGKEFDLVIVQEAGRAAPARN